MVRSDLCAPGNPLPPGRRSRRERLNPELLTYRLALRIVARIWAFTSAGSVGHTATTCCRSGSGGCDRVPTAPDSAPPDSGFAQSVGEFADGSNPVPATETPESRNIATPGFSLRRPRHPPDPALEHHRPQSVALCGRGEATSRDPLPPPARRPHGGRKRVSDPKVSVPNQRLPARFITTFNLTE